jgi:hypothetical protein
MTDFFKMNQSPSYHGFALAGGVATRFGIITWNLEEFHNSVRKHDLTTTRRD